MGDRVGALQEAVGFEGAENHLYVLAVLLVATGGHGLVDQVQAAAGILRVGKLAADITYHVEQEAC